MKNTKRKKWAVRQGDVWIERVSKISGECEKQKPINGKIILAYGEATGHHHAIDADKADWWKQGDEQFVTVHRPTQVVHQEHAPIALPPGRYRVLRQVEYRPQEIVRVAD